MPGHWSSASPTEGSARGRLTAPPPPKAPSGALPTGQPRPQPPQITPGRRFSRPPDGSARRIADCTVAALALVTLLAGSILLGLLALAVVPLAARLIINKRVEHQRVLFGEQLPAHLQELAAAMRAGSGIVLKSIAAPPGKLATPGGTIP